MTIRFTEYLKHDEQDISLYVVQEEIDHTKLGYKIFLKGQSSIVFALYREQGKPWQTLPQTVPQLVLDIKPQVIFLLEKQLMKYQSNAN